MVVVDPGLVLEPEREAARRRMAASTPDAWQPADRALTRFSADGQERARLQAPVRLRSRVPRRRRARRSRPMPAWARDRPTLSAASATSGERACCPTPTGTSPAGRSTRGQLADGYRAVLDFVPYAAEDDELAERYPLVRTPDGPLIRTQAGEAVLARLRRHRLRAARRRLELRRLTAGRPRRAPGACQRLRVLRPLPGRVSLRAHLQRRADDRAAARGGADRLPPRPARRPPLRARRGGRHRGQRARGRARRHAARARACSWPPARCRARSSCSARGCWRARAEIADSQAVVSALRVDRPHGRDRPRARPHARAGLARARRPSGLRQPDPRHPVHLQRRLERARARGPSAPRPAARAGARLRSPGAWSSGSASFTATTPARRRQLDAGQRVGAPGPGAQPGDRWRSCGASSARCWRTLGRVGLVPLAPLAEIAPPGGGYHYGASIPMSARPGFGAVRHARAPGRRRGASTSSTDRASRRFPAARSPSRRWPTPTG